MKQQLVTVAAVFAFAAPPALASQTSCTFEGGDAARYYELEFIGYSDGPPLIVFSSTAFRSGQRLTLPPASYALRAFSPKSATVALAFRNPGDASLPPSFALNGRGGAARLTIGRDRISGALRCGD